MKGIVNTEHQPEAQHQARTLPILTHECFVAGVSSPILQDGKIEAQKETQKLVYGQTGIIIHVLLLQPLAGGAEDPGWRSCCLLGCQNRAWSLCCSMAGMGLEPSEPWMAKFIAHGFPRVRDKGDITPSPREPV